MQHTTLGAIHKAQQAQIPLEPAQQPATTSNEKSYTISNYPRQNLIDKYKKPDTFMHAQNALESQLKIPNARATRQNKEEQILVKFLETQNSTLKPFNKISKFSVQEDSVFEKNMQELVRVGGFELLDTTSFAELLQKIQRQKNKQNQ